MEHTFLKVNEPMNGLHLEIVSEWINLLQLIFMLDKSKKAIKKMFVKVGKKFDS